MLGRNPDKGKKPEGKRVDELNKLFSNIKVPEGQMGSGGAREPPAASGTRNPSATDFESEWKKKIDDARKKDEQLVADTEIRGQRAQSFEEVFAQLKKGDAPSGESAKTKGRLGKIGETVKGEIPKIEERELTGEGISGIYNVYKLGSIPPLNLISKMLYSVSKASLDKDLEEAGIPLYADEYTGFAVAVGAILSVLVFVLMLLVMQFNILVSVVAMIVSMFLVAVALANIPSMQLRSSSRDIDRQLPFALRHMSALLGAGISIFDSIVSVSKADYGPLSDELDKVAWDVKSGENLTEALEDASDRIKSRAFTRVTIHIRRALQMGGDVARIISEIAEDMTFEMRMKVSDFVEKLNAFAIVYLIGGIVGPVVIAVFTVVGKAGPLQTFSGDAGAASVSTPMLMFFVLVIFPLVMAMITYIIKVMEPKA